MTSHRVTRSSTIQSPEGSNTRSEATTPVSTGQSIPNLRHSLRKRKPTQDNQSPLASQPSTKKSRLNTQQSSLESSPSTRNRKRSAKSDSGGDRSGLREGSFIETVLIECRSNMDTNSSNNPVTPEPSSRRKASRNKRRSASGQSQSLRQQSSPDKKSDLTSPTINTTPKENKKKNNGDDGFDADIQMGNTKHDEASRSSEEPDDLEDETMNEGESKVGEEEDGDRESKDDYDRDLDEDDMYDGDFGGHSRVSNAMRALSGMLNGIPTRLRDILVNLRNKEDISIQMIALQDLSEILLM